MSLNGTPKERKESPMFSGLLKYFPDALAYVAHVSYVGNEQHNPGQPMHWAREKSTDHGDCIVRHQAEAGTPDTDGLLHSGKVAWRALAQLQLELEAAKTPPNSYDGDWNTPLQGPGYWRIKGDTVLYMDDGLEESLVHITAARNNIDTGTWVRNTYRR